MPHASEPYVLAQPLEVGYAGIRPVRTYRPYVLLYLAGSVALAVLYLLVALCQSNDLAGWANTVGPIAFGLLSFGIALRILIVQPLMVWSPFTWFLGANILYFSIGVLVLKFGNAASIEHVHNFFDISEADVLRTNLLNCVGAAGVAAGLLLGGRLFSERPAPATVPPPTGKLKLAVVLCLATGLIVKYGFVLPYAFGFTNYVLPGSILNLQDLTGFCLIVLIVLNHIDSPKWRIVLYPLMVSEILTALLTFGKKNLLEAMIFILLGYFLVRPSKRLVLGGALILMLGYILSVNLVKFGRGELIAETGTHYSAGLEKRMKIVGKYVQRGGTEEESSEKQGWWTRLCYTSAQSFALYAYDQGQPGDSFELAWIVLIPRILWPEKPLITVGHNFNLLATGNPYSQSAPGFFAEAYWNGGWLYVLGAALFVGLLFSVYTKHALEKIGRLQITFLPCALIGMAIGYRSDTWFVATVIGGSALGLLVFLTLDYLTRAHYSRAVYEPGTGYQG